MELVTHPQFYFDIAEEIAYLARKAGRETAERWHLALDQTIKQLLRHPHIGRQRTDLKPAGIHTWRINHFRRWLIFYAVHENALVLFRVRYGMMDLSALEFES
jgi:plasmid stabilization system protein ParE